MSDERGVWIGKEISGLTGRYNRIIEEAVIRIGEPREEEMERLRPIMRVLCVKSRLSEYFLGQSSLGSLARYGDTGGTPILTDARPSNKALNVVAILSCVV